MTTTQQDPSDSSRRLRRAGFALLAALALPAIGLSEEAADSIPPSSASVEAAAIPAPAPKPGPGLAPPEHVPAPCPMSWQPAPQVAELPPVEAPNYEVDEDPSERGAFGSVAGGFSSLGRAIFPWMGRGTETASLRPGSLIESVLGEDTDTAETLSLVDAQGF